jgi:hypothetical protein
MPLWLLHDLLFAAIVLAAWFLFTYFYPRLLMSVYKRGLLGAGGGDGPIPINTLYTEPPALFADPLHAPASASKLWTTGVNHDTLVTAGWLDLRPGPQVLHVPDMHDRYYAVQFTDPAHNTTFAYVGKRATGTQAGDYLITGPGWQGSVPSGLKQIAAPNNSVLVLARVLVGNDEDLPAVYELSKQITLKGTA